MRRKESPKIVQTKTRYSDYHETFAHGALHCLLQKVTAECQKCMRPLDWLDTPKSSAWQQPITDQSGKKIKTILKSQRESNDGSGFVPISPESGLVSRGPAPCKMPAQWGPPSLEKICHRELALLVYKALTEIEYQVCSQTQYVRI